MNFMYVQYIIEYIFILNILSFYFLFRYGEYPELRSIFLKYIKIKDNVLIVGCGNSTVSMCLYDAGYRCEIFILLLLLNLIILNFLIFYIKKFI